jgi:hypothetical protein
MVDNKMHDIEAIEVLGAFAVVIFGCLMLYVNVWNYRRRSKMTPEERARDDAEHQRIPGDW